MEQTKPIFTPARVIAVAAFIFIFFTIAPIGQRPLFFPDETRYAQIPREMLRSGKYFAPTFLDMPYYEKPAGGYYLTVLSMKLFGETPFAARLPQAVCVLLSALTTMLLARKMMQDEGSLQEPEAENRRKWLPVAVFTVLLTMGEFLVTGVYAVLDPIFVFPVTAALACFYCACHTETILKKTGFLLLCGLFCGLAFLVKGFLGVVLPGMTAFFYLVWKKDWKGLLLMEWPVLLAFCALVLPWALRVHQDAPDFWNYFIMEEHIGRFANAASNGEFHKKPFWFYIPFLPVLMLPWSLYFIAAWKGFRKIPMNDGTKFLLVWIAGMFLLFSVAQGKLVTYLLPLFPACAILGTRALLTVWNESRFRIRVPTYIAAGILYFAGTIPFLLCILTFFSKKEMPPLNYYVTTFGIGVYAWLAAWIFRKADNSRAIVGVLLLSLGFLMFLPAFHRVPVAYVEKKTLVPCTEQFRKIIPAGSDLFIHRKYAGSVAWILDRTDFRIYDKPGEFAYGLKYNPSRRLDEQGFKTMLRSLGKGRKVFLVLPHKEYLNDFKKQYVTDAGKDVPLLQAEETRSGADILIFTGR